MKICIVGAGVIGLSTGLCIKNLLPAARLTIIADTFNPDTTSDVAGGVWEPHFVTYPDKQELSKWQKTTFNYIFDLSVRPNAHEYGAFMCPSLILESDKVEKPDWSDIVVGFNILSKDEIKRRTGVEYETGWTFNTLVLEGSKYLPYLTNELRKQGVNFEKRKLNSLEELTNYDVIVHCTGYGARKLVGDDNVVGYSGQVIKVDALHMKYFITSPTAYVIPRSDGLIMGGTLIEGDESRIPDEQHTKMIYEDCCKLLPQLHGCKILKVLKGIRPYRKNGVRLEKEVKIIGSKKLNIVHNYGHGGNGVTLHWGCALRAASLVKEFQQENL
ncbi:DgyrCDS12690 [Dimorphilus gyrociliatus]|uniref:DgyrCDS12690 n=1 Tax=Dimorphilus gyrociliatus TaxID=2664684 RepID=A0A7I8W788_9ANNE|nr:DgyrCDS12690 [Dimorphilus gyrociliatus]